MKLIGLTGNAGAGKDTIADWLVSQHAWRKVAFAQPLKDGLCAMFGWTPEQLLDREWKERMIPEYGNSPRQLMQSLGTEWGRNYVQPDLWLILARKQIEDKLEYRNVVVSDVRFNNEAQMIREMRGQIVHVYRSDATYVTPHSSEAGVNIAHGDRMVHNDGTIEELYGMIGRKL